MTWAPGLGFIQEMLTISFSINALLTIYAKLMDTCKVTCCICSIIQRNRQTDILKYVTYDALLEYIQTYKLYCGTHVILYHLYHAAYLYKVKYISDTH